MAKKRNLARFTGEATVYNLFLAGIIMGSMRWNPEIWVNDYPPDIKEAHGPLSEKAKKQATLISLPFLLVGVGGPLWSSLRLKRQLGGKLSLAQAFANVFGFIASTWLLDLVILDWGLFVTVTPDFVVLPGTEGMAGYNDYTFHLREHLRALPFLALASLVLAGLVLVIPVRAQ